MTLFRKIKDFFERRKALAEVYDDLQNLDQVLLEKKLEIFNEMITPRLAEIGLKNWNGKYLWFSDFNQEGIKQVVQFEVFRYFGGSFSFGICYDFVPTISNSNKLVYHKTDKSTKLIYYKLFSGWQEMEEKENIINIDKISTVNEEKLRQSIQEVFDRNIPKLKEWFEQNQTIDQNVESLLKEIKSEKKKWSYRVISFDYILAFLYAQRGDFDSAEHYIQKHNDRKILNAEEQEIQSNLLNEKIRSFRN